MDVSLESLESKALSYLERFDSSAAKLKEVLRRYALRRLGGQVSGVLPARTASKIDEIILRYSSSGIVSDARYAESIARTLREREVVFLGVGFETTAPAIAATILQAERENSGL